MEEQEEMGSKIFFVEHNKSAVYENGVRHYHSDYLHIQWTVAIMQVPIYKMKLNKLEADL